MPKLIDLTGKQFERLTVLQRGNTNLSGHVLWHCLCICGIETVVVGRDLTSGNTKSCGCLHKERLIDRLTTHGHSKSNKKSRLYYTWIDMKQRCTNPRNERYSSYGGRGITVCKRWMKFENFLEDVGESPTNKHILDRINNDDGYYPANCRWVTYLESNRNTRQNRLLTYHGQTKCATEWSEQFGINLRTLLHRLRHGWSTERALTQPVNKRMSRK